MTLVVLSQFTHSYTVVREMYAVHFTEHTLLVSIIINLKQVIGTDVSWATVLVKVKVVVGSRQ